MAKEKPKSSNLLLILLISFGVLCFILLIVIAGGDDTKTSTNNALVSTPSSSNTQTLTTTSTTQSWHTLKTYTGTSDKTTDTFSTQGSKFRLTYTVNPANEYSSFYLTVYQEGNSFMTKLLSLESGTESSIIYSNSGKYYLDIGAANLNSWTIKVEDYY